jgi:hypothetical protein
MIYPSIKYLGPAHPMRVPASDTQTDETPSAPVRHRERARRPFRRPYGYATLQVVERVPAAQRVDLELPLAA